MPDLAGVAPSGDRLATLRVLRDRLAGDLDGCGSARDVAALAQRLMDVLEQIAVVEKTMPQGRETPRDAVAEKRKQREAVRAAGASRASGAAKR